MSSGQNTFNQTLLSQDQLANLQQLTAQLSPLQLAWTSGYLAAKSEQGQTTTVEAPQTAAAASVLTILYASQTGNAKGVATKLAEQAKQAGVAVNLKNIADYKAKSLKNEQYLIIVSSTNGEGEPPDDAIEFHEFLLSKKAPKLPNLQFSVLALGDSSYEFFCQTGKDFDNRLAELGATRVVDRVDCDVDYQASADAWAEKVVAEYQSKLKQAQPSAAVVAFPGAQQASQYSKENPFQAELLVSQKITGRDSNKDVRHVEIDLSESGLSYQPGDALGIWPENDAELAKELISLLSLDENTEVEVAGKSVSLLNALVELKEITQTPVSYVKHWAELANNEQLTSLVADANALREFANNTQVVDLVRQYPASVSAQDLVDSLRNITPRLYSIASSQAEVEDEVHLTVGLVSYEKDGKQRFGTASSLLANRLQEGDKVKVFIEHNNNFRLPENNDTPVIMIGPGTGVAPFRAFMQEREARDASGKNWMFFGDQTFTQDFLYQVEWQNYLKSGLLTKMDVAFSRDQAEKVYVQHRLLEQAEEVFAWLEQGAHLYVCGDANHMAKDVHAALVQIVSEQGQMSQQQAEDYLKQLRSDKRYQKDVY